MIFPCSCHPLCNIPSHTFHSAYASKSSEVFPLTLIRHLYPKLMLLFYCHLREYPWRFRKRNWPGKWPRLFSPKRQSSWNKRDFTDSSAWCWHSLDKKQLPCSFLKEQTHVKIPHIPVWLYVAKLFWCFLFVLYFTTISMYTMCDTQRCLTAQILFFLTRSSLRKPTFHELSSVKYTNWKCHMSQCYMAVKCWCRRSRRDRAVWGKKKV